MAFSLRCLNKLLCITPDAPLILVSRRNYVRRVRQSNKAPNVGLQRQINLLDQKDNLDVDDPSLDFDEHESDFHQVGESYSEFKKDMIDYKEKEKQWIIKRKYFKEVTPNFLTWSEKEQIKHLHQTDPVAYSVERLSEIFPATNQIVHKVIKSSWKIKNPSRILKHDKSVESNWQLLKKGKISLAEGYKKHLEKFSSREQIVLDENNYIPKKNMTMGPEEFTTTSKQFSSIIQSYVDSTKAENTPKQIESNIDDINSLKKCEKPLLETYIVKTEKKVSNKPQLFSSFKKEMEGDQSLSTENCKSDINLNNTKKSSKQILVQDTPVPIFGKKYHENHLSENNKTLPAPNKINIPKKLRKKGQTYKVNDCFYDDDGFFLYRVPGLEQING